MLPRIVPQPANLNLDKTNSHSHIASKMLSVIYILYSLEAGIFLLWLPWLSLWENNHMLYLYPQIRTLVANPFFKGAILGLGIDNILMGIWQVVHFKNAPRGFLS
jgi:hypothetical protein